MCASMSPANSGEKQARGRFRKGQSGNPAGKPKGARHRITVLAEKLMEDDAKSIVEAVVIAAKEGDMAAARLVLDRIAPLRKGRSISLRLPTIDRVADVTNALGSIIATMAKGEITPDEAATIAGILESKRKALETVEIEKRIAALEQMAVGRK